MGHEMKDKDLKGENISTVGVDIGTFEIQRGNDKVVFSTWDFGGQVISYLICQIVNWFLLLNNRITGGLRVAID